MIFVPQHLRKKIREEKLVLRLYSSAIPWFFLTALLRIGGILLLLPITLRILPSTHLGLWYTFLSISGLIGLVDLGLFSSASRAISYLWGGARELKGEGLVESEPSPEEHRPNFALLRDLAKTLSLYYLILGSLSSLGSMFLGGWWIWRQVHSLPDARFLMGAWFVFCIGGLLNSLGMIWPAMLSGINGVRQAQQITVLSILVSYLITISTLLLGLDIYAMVLGNLGMGLCVRFSGRWAFLRLAGQEFQRVPGKINWNLMAQLWPTAWRQGIVGVGTFLAMNANTLICSQFLNLSTTASYGLSLQIAQSLAMFSAIWIQAKMPLIGILRTQSDHLRIATIFATRMRLVVISYILGAAFFIFYGPVFIAYIKAGTPLLPKPLFSALLIIYLLELHHSQYASLVLTENRNPFLFPALISGISIVSLSIWLTPHYGVMGMIFAQGSVQACFSNWWPVLRAIQGLKIAAADYWKLFFYRAPCI